MDESVTRSLRKYQQEAIDEWLRNDCTGIWEMATGTGKTFTAIKAIDIVREKDTCALIVTPQKEIASQWSDEIRSYFPDAPLMECWSDTGWHDGLERFLGRNRGCFSVIVAVRNTFISDVFQDMIFDTTDRMIFVADEVHEFGATCSVDALIYMGLCEKRLGLSATPLHAWDMERNDKVTGFFGDVIFKWGLRESIYPPEGYERCLVPYRYFIEFASLSESEMSVYRDLSGKINKRIAALKGSGDMMMKIRGHPSIEKLMFLRADLVQSCEARFGIMQRIIEANNVSLNKCIIYCENINEIERIQRILSKMGKDALVYHSRLDTSSRRLALDEFKNGASQFIIAVGCLDQGVDIPNCDSAIILSSSKTPREYVQRRGRVLRLNGHDKHSANIFDIFILPVPLDSIDSDDICLDDIEIQLMTSQIQRIDEFADCCINSFDCHVRMKRINRICGGGYDGTMD